jgi:hypothetical protein
LTPCKHLAPLRGKPFSARQTLEHDGVGHVVASLADAIGPLAFSSLAATRGWLATDAAKGFTRAFRKARAWLLRTPAAKVAGVEVSFLCDRAAARLNPVLSACYALIDGQSAG